MEFPAVQIAQELAAIKAVDKAKAVIPSAIQNVILPPYPPEQRSEGPRERHDATPGIRAAHLLEPRVTKLQTLAQTLVRVRDIFVRDPVIVVISGSPSDEQ